MRFHAARTAGRRALDAVVLARKTEQGAELVRYDAHEGDRSLGERPAAICRPNPAAPASGVINVRPAPAGSRLRRSPTAVVTAPNVAPDPMINSAGPSVIVVAGELNTLVPEVRSTSRAPPGMFPDC